MFEYARLKDPDYYRENRADAHSDHEWYISEDEARRGETSLKFSLNGMWKFAYARNDGQIPAGFEEETFDCSGWDSIRVPAHMQLEGWDAPQYANTEYPWDGHEQIMPGQIPEKFNPVGCYVRYFELPENMKGRRVFISFEGVESCVALWLNGQYIGFSSDSFTPHEFELTDALREGRNKLACRVYKWCSASWLEDQDFLRFSGIYRDVWLFALPEAHIRNLRVTALPDDGFTKGILTWQAADIIAPEGTVITAVLSREGEKIAEGKTAVTGKAAPEGTLVAESAVLWSAEHPELYDLELRVAAPSGETEYIRQRVGFRRIEIKDSVIRINGVRVVFRGVNRHDFCGETGRAVPEEKIREALLLMKRNNINAIRTSHYPNSGALYRMCDELGFYVIDENNMESHGMWEMLIGGRIGKDQMFPGNRMEWAPMLVDRVRSVTGRDRNHPSVVIWSCGNESLTGRVILEMSREFKRLDPTRPVHYEGDHQVEMSMRLREITDIESEMYTPAAKVRKYLKENRDKPFILCEYTHSMGNSNGAMIDYTELAYEDELYQGGFIWDFMDQALVYQDRFGRERLTYGGDWGDRPSDGIFCGNGIVFADGKETPKLQEVKYCYQGIAVRVDGLKAEIINRYMFTRTSEFACEVRLEKDGKPAGKWRMETDVAPLSSEVYDLPVDMPADPGEYAVTVSFLLKEDKPWAKAGFETAFGQGVFTVEGPAKKREGGKLTFTDSPWNIGVIGDNFEVMFSRLTGALTSYRYGGREYLASPLMPNFWRAPTNNDMGNRMPQRYAQWKAASMYVTALFMPGTLKRNAEERPVMQEDGSVSFSMAYDLPTSPAACCTVSYRVFGCGEVKVTLRYDPVKELGDMPEFGMIMKLDADMNRVRYYGLGPEENYTDRREGARLGIWEYRADQNLTPYLMPQECGNRTGVRWAEIKDARGHGLRIGLNGGEFSALPWTPHEIENAAHAYELPPVSSTVIKMSKVQMGVGGDDSWGARTHDEYLIDISKPLEFRFSFRGI